MPVVSRLRSTLGWPETLAILRPWEGTVTSFEETFASQMGARYAVVFPYARTGLHAILHALGIRDREIIMTAYTCAVVAHAIVKSGNQPAFVDITGNDFNQNFDQIEANLSARTGAVIVTHMYGYPSSLERIRKLVHGGAVVIQDCALALGTRWKGTRVSQDGVAAYYSLNLGKQMTCLSGGVVTTNDDTLYKGLKKFQSTMLHAPGPLTVLKKVVAFAGQSIAFHPLCYRTTDWLLGHTSLLRPWSRSRDEEEVDLPGNAYLAFAPVQARIGMVQLKRMAWILKRREEIARTYDARLRGHLGAGVLPPIVEGATYSHYTPRFPNQKRFRESLRRRGVYTGRVFDYSVPDLPYYQNLKSADCPNSRQAAQEAVNLPNYPSLDSKAQERVIDAVLRTAQETGL